MSEKEEQDETLQRLANRLDGLLDEHPDLEALTKEIGLKDKTALDHYRAGRRAPRPSTMVKLADALGVSTDYLLGRSPERVDVAPTLEIDARDYKMLGLAMRAGAGGPIAHYDEEDALQLAFRADWLRASLGTDDVSPRSVFLAEADGDSMEPGIRHGAVVLARRWYAPDTREEFAAELEERGVYVIKKDVTAGESGMQVKRLALDRDQLVILSDNPRYAPKVISLRREDDVEPVDVRQIIMGRVIWVGQEVGGMPRAADDASSESTPEGRTARASGRHSGRPKTMRRQPDVGYIPRYEEDQHEFEDAIQ